MVYGISLGAVPAIEQVLGDPGCALLLEAPFTSASGLLQDAGVTWPESFMSAGRLSSEEKIRGYNGPLFVMAAELDILLLYRDGARGV